MSGEDQDGPAGMAVQDASEDLNRAHLARPRSRLKIIFVNSSPYRRSARVRRNTTRAVHQTESLSFTPEHGPLAGDPDSSANCFQCEASEDESDQDYDDDEARSTKRPRARRNEWHTRKQKRHGRLAAADRDLIFAAQQGGLAHKPPKKKAPRIAKADAVNLIATIAERVDWRRAVAVQQELQAMSNEPVAKSDMLESGRKSVLPKMDGDAALAECQLKQYWSNVLVSSVLENEN
jgi:hypothetical protein